MFWRFFLNYSLLTHVDPAPASPSTIISVKDVSRCRLMQTLVCRCTHIQTAHTRTALGQVQQSKQLCGVEERVAMATVKQHSGITLMTRPEMTFRRQTSSQSFFSHSSGGDIKAFSSLMACLFCVTKNAIFV